MTEVALKRENDREIVFANRPVLAFLTGLAVLAGAWAVHAYMDDGPRGLLLAVIGAIAVACFFGALRRERLVLDLAQRSYTRDTGYWPRVRTVSGPLEDIARVTLTTELRSRGVRQGSGARQYRVWIVGLEFRNDEKPLHVFEGRSEKNGYARFEALARRLRVTAVDRTGPEGKTTPWERVGEPLAERLRGAAGSWPVAIPPLPPASRIQLVDDAGRRRIVLPAHGFTFWVPVLFVLPAGLMALGAALALEGLADPLDGGLALGVAFFLIGAYFAFMITASLFGKDWIAEERDNLAVGSELFGMTWRRQRTPKREIDEIEIKAAGRGQPEHQEVMLRSRRWVRRLGAHLAPQEREWLRTALMAMVQ